MTEFKKSSRCATATCVEVGKADDDTILIRDSKDPDGEMKSIPGPAWDSFVEDVKAGKFDLDAL